jgi:peroxiredoxin
VVALVVLALLTALHVSFSYQLLKLNGRLVARVEALERGADGVPGLRVGAPAPSFSLRALDDRLVALEDLVAGGPVLLVFGDARCESCDAVLAAVGRAPSDADGRRVVVVAGGSMEDNRVKAQRYGLPMVLVQHEHEVASAYGVDRVPAAVPVGTDGRIAGPLASSPEAVRALLRKKDLGLPQLVIAGGSAQRPVTPRLPRGPRRLVPAAGYDGSWGAAVAAPSAPWSRWTGRWRWLRIPVRRPILPRRSSSSARSARRTRRCEGGSSRCRMPGR